jgi:hypothetical protein
LGDGVLDFSVEPKSSGQVPLRIQVNEQHAFTGVKGARTLIASERLSFLTEADSAFGKVQAVIRALQERYGVYAAKETDDSDETGYTDGALISKRVMIGLMEGMGLECTTVDVETKDGRVYLKGSVRDQSAKERAQHIAMEVGGAKVVVNELRVEEGVHN